MNAVPLSFTTLSKSLAFLFLAASGFFIALPEAQARPNGEFILVSGGPSLNRWEQYRADPHDRWWGNFIRAARVRIEQIQEEHGQDAFITWLVYREGYERRAAEEGRPLISFIESVRDKYGVNLVWFNTTDQFLNYINRGQDRSRMKIINFEYYGHSNRACFCFDYSNLIANASKVWLHENELRGAVKGRAFARNAFIKSWGCHTGESMSQKWRQATGRKMIGAVGKTDYSYGYRHNWIPQLSAGDGRWTH